MALPVTDATADLTSNETITDRQEAAISVDPEANDISGSTSGSKDSAIVEVAAEVASKVTATSGHDEGTAIDTAASAHSGSTATMGSSSVDEPAEDYLLESFWGKSEGTKMLVEYFDPVSSAFKKYIADRVRRPSEGFAGTESVPAWQLTSVDGSGDVLCLDTDVAKSLLNRGPAGLCKFLEYVATNTSTAIVVRSPEGKKRDAASGAEPEGTVRRSLAHTCAPLDFGTYVKGLDNSPLGTVLHLGLGENGFRGGSGKASDYEKLVSESFSCRDFVYEQIDQTYFGVPTAPGPSLSCRAIVGKMDFDLSSNRGWCTIGDVHLTGMKHLESITFLTYNAIFQGNALKNQGVGPSRRDEGAEKNTLRRLNNGESVVVTLLGVVVQSTMDCFPIKKIAGVVELSSMKAMLVPYDSIMSFSAEETRGLGLVPEINEVKCRQCFEAFTTMLLSPKDDTVMAQYPKQATGLVRASKITSATAKPGRPKGSTEGRKREDAKAKHKPRDLLPAIAATSAESSMVPFNSKRSAGTALSKGMKALKVDAKATASWQTEPAHVEPSSRASLGNGTSAELSKLQCELAVHKATSAVKEEFEGKLTAVKDESFRRQIQESERRAASAEASTAAAAAGANALRAEEAARYERQDVRNQQFTLEVIRTVGTANSQGEKSASRETTAEMSLNAPGSCSEVDTAADTIKKINALKKEAADFRALAQMNDDDPEIFEKLSSKALKKENEAKDLKRAL